MDVWRSNLPAILNKLRLQLHHSGRETFAKLRNGIQEFDKDGSGTLERREFEKLMGWCGLFLTTQELSTLFRVVAGETEPSCIATVSKGDLNRFFELLRGSLPSARAEMVEFAWSQLDIEGKGAVDLEFLISAFNPLRHPHVEAGRLSPDTAIQRLRDAFAELGCTDVVTEDHFVKYFEELSACTPPEKDLVFRRLMLGGFSLETGPFDVSEERVGDIILGMYEKLQCLQRQKSPSVYQACHKCFHLFDKDECGALDFNEFSDFMKHIGVLVAQHELEAVFGEFAGSLDSRVEFQRLYAVLREINAGPHSVIAPGVSSSGIPRGTLVGSPGGNGPPMPVNAIEKIRSHLHLKAKDGMSELSKAVRAADKEKNGYLSPDEFKWVLREVGVEMGGEDLLRLMRTFDTNRDGKVSTAEFLIAVKNDVPPRRFQLIQDAWNKLVTLSLGRPLEEGEATPTYVPVELLVGVYDPAAHPKVLKATWTKDAAIDNFVDFLGEEAALGRVQEEAFIEYLVDQSTGMSMEAYFARYMKVAFGMDDDC